MQKQIRSMGLGTCCRLHIGMSTKKFFPQTFLLSLILNVQSDLHFLEYSPNNRHYHLQGNQTNFWLCCASLNPNCVMREQKNKICKIPVSGPWRFAGFPVFYQVSCVYATAQLRADAHNFPHMPTQHL